VGEGGIGVVCVCFSQCCVAGGHKRQTMWGGFCPPTCFGMSCASDANGVICWWWGVIDRGVADMEAAKKHYHVPAMSSDGT